MAERVRKTNSDWLLWLRIMQRLLSAAGYGHLAHTYDRLIASRREAIARGVL